MKINPKRIRLAFRSPGHFRWAVRHVLRAGPLGEIERRFLKGYALRPDLLSINITARCNLRCAMCMQPRTGADGGDSPTLRRGGAELTPDQWRRVVDQAASARPVFYFTGGEPLLYKGLDQILRHIQSRGLMAAIVTNGTTLSTHAESLVAAGVQNVTVSLDGPEEVHDRIRGVAGTFRRAIEGIRALQEARRRTGTDVPSIKVNCVITRHSIPTLANMVGIVRDLGVDELNLQHPMFDSVGNVELHNRVFPKAVDCRLEAVGTEENGNAPAQSSVLSPQSSPLIPPASKGLGEFYDEQLAPEEYEHLEGTLLALFGKGGGGPPRIEFFPPVRRKDWRGYYLDLSYPFRRRCAMPWTTMRLLADGTFEPCLHYVIGNVAEAPLWDLWNCARMRDFRRGIVRSGLFPACVRCCYRCY
jgi:MoaA/NifB/PqqE/SkfB family radical SAM enzyme